MLATSLRDRASLQSALGVDRAKRENGVSLCDQLMMRSHSDIREHPAAWVSKVTPREQLMFPSANMFLNMSHYAHYSVANNSELPIKPRCADNTLVIPGASDRPIPPGGFQCRVHWGANAQPAGVGCCLN